MLGGTTSDELTGDASEQCLELDGGRLCRRALSGSAELFDLVHRPSAGGERTVGERLAVLQMGRGLDGLSVARQQE
jgi:hypothetical protein